MVTYKYRRKSLAPSEAPQTSVRIEQCGQQDVQHDHSAAH